MLVARNNVYPVWIQPTVRALGGRNARTMGGLIQVPSSPPVLRSALRLALACTNRDSAGGLCKQQFEERDGERGSVRFDRQSSCRNRRQHRDWKSERPRTGAGRRGR